jgi:hypothetical protein
MTTKYRHIRTWHIYYVVGTGKEKIDGKLTDVITYQDAYGKLFTRPLQYFELNFELATE